MYTKGKWRMSSLVSPEKPKRYASIYAGEKGEEIEIAAINVEWELPKKQRESGHANARLIAAAPDLLEACKEGLQAMINMGGKDCYNGMDTDENGDCVCTACKMKRAIAKVEKEGV